MFILVIALTWACPSGLEHKTRLQRSYPKQLEQAMEEFKMYNQGVNTITTEIQGETCTLVDVRGGNKKKGPVNVQDNKHGN